MKPGVDYVGVGVGAVIVDEDGRLFLARRGPEARAERGLWEFPGGTVEFGERLTDALLREIDEEFGIEVSVGDMLDVVDIFIPEEQQHWVSIAYICRIISGVPSIQEPEKCTEFGWFFPDETPATLSRFTTENLRHYKQFLENGATGIANSTDRLGEVKRNPPI